MKRCVLGLIGLVLLGAPAAAAAQEPPACRITTAGDPGEEYGRVGQLAQPIAADVAAWMGEQFGGFWQQPRDGNWYLGRAPGPVTADEVRDRALELIDARHDGEDEQRLRDRLRVVEQPYGESELRRVQDELTAKAAERRWSVSWAIAAGCVHSDALRVEFELYRDATPEIVAEARRMGEPYGDRVRVVHLPDTYGPTPTAFRRPAAPRVADLVRVRGCRVSLRRSARARVRVRSLRVRRSGPRRAAVRIRLKDGRVVRGTVRLRSCASS